MTDVTTAPPADEGACATMTIQVPEELAGALARLDGMLGADRSDVRGMCVTLLFGIVDNLAQFSEEVIELDAEVLRRCASQLEAVAAVVEAGV